MRCCLENLLKLKSPCDYLFHSSALTTNAASTLLWLHPLTLGYFYTCLHKSVLALGGLNGNAAKILSTSPLCSLAKQNRYWLILSHPSAASLRNIACFLFVVYYRNCCCCYCKDHRWHKINVRPTILIAEYLQLCETLVNLQKFVAKGGP